MSVWDVVSNAGQFVTDYGLYLLWALSLTVLFGASWLLNLVTLPGNWFVWGIALLAAWLTPDSYRCDIQWPTVVVLLVLSIAGEIVEAFAAMGNTARVGSSRRATALAFVGALVGSVLGVTFGIPIPVIGSAIGALFGGALGAFVGAAAGEQWKGSSWDRGVEVGRAAFFGRLLGTTGKLVLGAIMTAMAIVDAWL